MSTLKADTIVATDGTSPVTLTKQSAAKAWNNINGTGTIAIRDSFNISSITDTGTGSYKHTMTNAMSTSDDYSLSGFARVSASAGFFGGDTDSTFTSTTIQHATFNYQAASWADALYATLSVDGDLA